MYRRFCILPAAGDRHLAEFVPWCLAIDDPDGVHRWGFELTTSEFQANTWPDRDDHRRRKLDGDLDHELEPSGEELVEQLSALVGPDDAYCMHLNVLNQDQVANLPSGAVMETNILMGTDDLNPMTTGSPPPQVRTVVERHVQNQETLAEAGFAGDSIWPSGRSSTIH